MKPLFAFLTSVSLALIPAAAGAADLPNILWITSEDNGLELGCYGDNYAVSPHIDGLAARSLRYVNALSTAPVCAPARTTIISGIYPPASGGMHMRSMAELPADFKMYPEFLKELGYYCTNNSKEDYNLKKPADLWHESSKKGHWKNRPEGVPFFAIFNHTISHESQIRNAISPEDQIHDPAGARIPAYHPDTAEVRRDWAQYYDRITMMDKLVGKNLKELEEAGLADDTIVFYYGDHGSGMPRHKRWPYNSGLNVPMLVHFPKKWAHLAPEGYEAGAVSDRIVGFIDLAPTLLSIVGTEPPKWMQGLAFAGKFETEEPEFGYGFRDRMDERIDMVRTVRGKRFNYIRNYKPHKLYGQYIQYMFVTPTTQTWHDMFHAGELSEAQSHFWQTKPAEELYDLQEDPDEVNNLAGSAEHAETLAKMRQAHADWSAEVKDVGLLAEWEFHHRAAEAGVTPYEVGHDPELFDHESIYAAAELANLAKADELPEVVSLLGAEDSAVRYWGAVGLLIQEKAGLKAGYQQMLAALEDESPIVQIIAAESLGRYGSDDDAAKAMEVLLGHIKPEGNTYLGIAAWNAIDYLGEVAKPAVDTLVATSDKPASPPERVGNYAKSLKSKVLADLGVKPAREKDKKKKK
ncbi:MAG: arylsulfatase A-like enzyme [Verrucomicrobiales bacterium]|jgi:arylsulfatase A-like enzyme